MDPAQSPSFVDSEAIHARIEQLFAALPSVTAPTNNNMMTILGVIGDVMGKDGGSFQQNCNDIKLGPKSFFEQLNEAKERKDFASLIAQFDYSVTPLNKEEVDKVIAEFCSDIAPALRTFLQCEEPLQLWVPDSSNPYAEHLQGLKFPVTPSGEPDMVLYGLGRFQQNRELRKQLDLFYTDAQVKPGAYTTLLLNTSGAGKTKTTIETLCRLWGFYLTCKVDQGLGSADLNDALEIHITKDRRFKKTLPRTNYEDDHEANCGIARARLREVLLARVCIFELFCAVAKEKGFRLEREELRKRWVILQIKPSCLPGRSYDIFQDLASKLKGADEGHRKDLLDRTLKQLTIRLKCPAFICVVDEAQIAAAHLTEAFVTRQSGNSTRRSSLREVKESFSLDGLPICLNFTGTGIRRKTFLEAIASATVKVLESRTVTHFGAFDSRKEQTDYIKEFIPATLNETESFQALYERAFYWLKGRYRFTANFVKLLLLSGFQNPHRLLNAYIRSVTQFEIPGTVSQTFSPGFQPSDREDCWENAIIGLPDFDAFHFYKLNLPGNENLKHLVQRHTRQYWMRGTILNPLHGNEKSHRLIEYGFARYHDKDKGWEKSPTLAFDEPLVLLAFEEWTQVYDVPLAEHLRSDAEHAVTEASGANGLEEYLALYFSTVFDGKTPLTDIFQFRDDPPEWAKRSATLVSLYKNKSKKATMRTGKVEHGKRPSVIIGRNGSSKQQTLEWLKHNDLSRAPIYFPDQFMGPDLIFILELEDGRKIWVAVQSKFGSGDVLGSDVLRKAVPTVTPIRWFSHKSKDTPKDDGSKQSKKKAETQKKRKKTQQKNSSKNGENVLETLDALPNRVLPPPELVKLLQGRKDAADSIVLGESQKKAILESAGLHSVLRVIVGWPATPDMHDRAERWKLTNPIKDYVDEEYHPIVELKSGHWDKVMRRLRRLPEQDAEGPSTEKQGNKRPADSDSESNDGPPHKKHQVGDGNDSQSVPLRMTRSVADALGISAIPPAQTNIQSPASSRVFEPSMHSFVSAVPPPSSVVSTVVPLSDDEMLDDESDLSELSDDEQDAMFESEDHVGRDQYELGRGMEVDEEDLEET